MMQSGVSSKEANASKAVEVSSKKHAACDECRMISAKNSSLKATNLGRRR